MEPSSYVRLARDVSFLSAIAHKLILGSSDQIRWLVRSSVPVGRFGWQERDGERTTEDTVQAIHMGSPGVCRPFSGHLHESLPFERYSARLLDPPFSLDRDFLSIVRFWKAYDHPCMIHPEEVCKHRNTTTNTHVAANNRDLDRTAVIQSVQ